jgi:hypothetical protein
MSAAKGTGGTAGAGRNASAGRTTGASRSTGTGKTAGRSTGNATAAPARTSRSRLIRVAVVVGAIAAAYGAGRLQGALALRSARAAWQVTESQLNASVETKSKEIAALKSSQTLWQLHAGISEVMADIADKNYGLARDGAREASGVLSRSLADMDAALRDRLQPLVPLLDDTARTADEVSPEARTNAQRARALVQEALAQPPAGPAGGSGGQPPPPASLSPAVPPTAR